MRTIARDGHTELVVQRSRFIATLGRVDTETDARELTARVRKRHHAARHHAVAWILGPEGEARRGNDDGEPSGTAAAPMLAVLAGAELTMVAAVVTRYFGGIKLGTGGLARAYGGAVAQAVAHLGTVPIRTAHTVTVTVDHAHAARLEAELRGHGATVTGTDYDTAAHLHLVVDDVDALTRAAAVVAPAARVTVTGTTTVVA